jgi:hypothetical protein
MSVLIALGVAIVFNAVILAALPFVRYKSFVSCVATAALAAIIAVPVDFLGGVLEVLAKFLLLFIPFIGPLIIYPLVKIFLLWILSALSLFIADQIIEDFEIPTLGQTFMAALLLGLAKFLALAVLGFFLIV